MKVTQAQVRSRVLHRHRILFRENIPQTRIICGVLLQASNLKPCIASRRIFPNSNGINIAWNRTVDLSNVDRYLIKEEEISGQKVDVGWKSKIAPRPIPHYTGAIFQPRGNRILGH